MALLPAVLAGSAAAPTATAAAPAQTARTVRTPMSEVARLADRGAISERAAAGYREVHRAARRTLGKLSGTRRTELRAVLTTLDRVAAAGELRSGRMPLAFLTLRRNREWWSTRSLLSYGRRVQFPGSSLVWQAYPGQGIQVQWLATFGKANGFMSGGRRTYDEKLRRLLRDATGLAAERAGGIAWESWFAFGGGRPPWVSALSQGTALQAYSRAAVHLRDPRLFDVARRGLGIFRKAPPTGVRVRTPAGSHLLIYSFSPRLRVLNAFTQAVNGLHDFAVLARDEEGSRLYREAEAELRAVLPRFDTGAWSLYSLAPRESDLGYHTLLRDFLRGLCTRTTQDRRRESARQADAVTGDPTSGGVAPDATGTAGVDPATLPDPDLYCRTAARFTADLRTPPVVRLASRTRPATPRARRTLSLSYTLSKISTVTTQVTREGRTVAGRTSRLGRGSRTLRFVPPRAGRYAISVRAVDLAGNATRASTAITVTTPDRPTTGSRARSLP